MRREAVLPAALQPDGWSVNARCLDEATRPVLLVSEFDGRNWDAHAADLAHLSKESV